MILRAKYVVPVAGEVIEDGMLEVRDGRIAHVGHVDGLLSRGAVDFQDAVLCPGFINAHTHLELSALAQRVPPSADFTSWLMGVVRESARHLSNPEDIRNSVRTGVRDSLRSGVVAVGDITRHPAIVRRVLAESPLTARSFGEVIAIGTGRSLADERIAAAVASAPHAENVRAGLSPHAPYSVEPHILRRCAEVAADRGLPVTIHVAEFEDETRFTKERGGIFAELLHSLGVWDEAISIAGRTPVALLQDVGLLSPRCLLAHANQVGAADAELIRRSGASVAYCPRTHAAFGHRPHPFQDYLRAGINICLATDSLASNPSLSVLDEARFVRQLAPRIDPATLMEMITVRPARALGLEGELGTLEPGKWASFNAVGLTQDDPWSAVFDGNSELRAMYIRGRRVEGVAQT